MKKTEEELEEERRKQRIEINETKEDIRIFKELEVLKSLIGEWAKTISRKVPKGSPAERVKILNEIARIRRDQSIRDRLERVSVKEMKNIDHLVEQTGNYGSNKKKMVRGMEDLIKEEASLNLFFEKLLSYLVYTIETVPNPNPSVPLGVIDKALAVEARIIRIQKQEINYGKIKAREDEGEIKSESPIIQ